MRTAGLAALVGLGATWYAGYSGLRESSTALTTAQEATTAVLHQMQADMMHDALRGDVLLALMSGPGDDPANVQAIRESAVEHSASFRLSIDTLDGLELAPELRGELEILKPMLDDYLQRANDVAATALLDPVSGLGKLPDFTSSFERLEVAMGRLAIMIEDRGAASGAQAHAAIAARMQVMNIASVVVALTLVLSNFLLSRSIMVPLERVRVAIREVAAGNLGGRFSSFDRASDLTDEVSEIAHSLEMLRVRLREALDMEQAIQCRQNDQAMVVGALSVGLENLSAGNLSETIDTPFTADYETLRANFNRTVQRLNQTITEVVAGSRSIRERVETISAATGDLSLRTNNQAATLEETAAALDQLTASVKAAADGAREVEGIVRSARREAEESGRVVVDAVGAMTGIEKSSGQISQIIGVIDDIAFQTNLLALNAGVEAARAGEAGRGFAVVASEVRALAQRSSDASREIKELIGSSTQFVSRGVASVGAAGKALTAMADRVSEISTLVSGIAAAAVEQSNGLAEVNIGVTQLDQVAQKNASMVEESMNITQSLERDVIGLHKLVSQFTTTSAVRSDPDQRPMVVLRAVAGHRR